MREVKAILIIPDLLKTGDTVAVTATSGPCDPQKLAKGVKVLEAMGLNVKVMPSCYARHGTYLAGTDKMRLDDLHAAFANRNVKGIFAARGGYGAARLLPHLDYEMIRKNAKVFVGFSDVTALHIAFNQICKMVTFHGPMVASCLGEADGETVKALQNAVMHPSAESLFIGGNLSVVASTIGTPWEIETRGRILFLEEIQEEPYRVDRLLLQLKLAGKFEDAAGIAFGSFHPETLETLKIAIDELVLSEGKPTVWGMPCGHTSPNITLRLGG